ncbi:nitrogenase component 1 [Rubrobacter indicoceani]|uniref:nitrogenase component 1 n=1 Tax=Rubrobacter indicoceani TaxID=2051957 RepID=UPI000E5B13A0|nr:nitrogenase component 1 [Rubrobacter indicoceani]
MTVLNESGIPDVTAPLHAANGLADRMGGALVVILGTRSEAFIAQSIPAAPMPGFLPPPRSPRLVFTVLDPSRPPEQGRIASRLVETAAGFRGLDCVFLVSGWSAKVVGVDAAFEARLAERRLEIPVEVLDPDGLREVPGVLSTDLEDRAMAAMISLSPNQSSSELLLSGRAGRSPAKGGERRRGIFGMGRDRTEAAQTQTSPVVLVGGFGSPFSLSELAGTLRKAGVRVEGVIPAGTVGGLPGIGEGTVVGLLDTNLGEVRRAAEERGALVVETLTPVGVDGTARFLQDVSAAAGGSTSELGRARSLWQNLQHLRNRVRGKRIFFCGDTGLELPLARFLTDAGAVIVEIGMPRFDRRRLSEELQALGPDVDIVEAPDWRGQMDRIERSRPDAVVASAGLYGPLVARGHLCRSSADLTRLGVHGYEGARRVLQMFARTFERAEELDSSLNV